MEGIVIHAMYQKLGGGFSLRMPWLNGQTYTFEMEDEKSGYCDGNM